MREEKLQQLKEMLPLVKKMVDEDLAITIFDREGTVLYFQKADTFPLHFDIGYRIENRNDKIFEAMRTGKVIHNKLSKEVFGVAIQGNLVPVEDDGQVVGIITCAFSTEHKEKIGEEAIEMNNALNETKDSINDIKNGAVDLSGALNNIKDIMKVVEKNVSDVVSVVNSIRSNASRSNILSLNASIEAAKAGETGKGFTIVASEMGKLAKMSGESANQIDKALNEMIKSIEGVAKAVHGSNDIAATQAEAVQKITLTLENITQSANLISKTINK